MEQRLARPRPSQAVSDFQVQFSSTNWAGGRSEEGLAGSLAPTPKTGLISYEITLTEKSLKKKVLTQLLVWSWHWELLYKGDLEVVLSGYFNTEFIFFLANLQISQIFLLGFCYSAWIDTEASQPWVDEREERRVLFLIIYNYRVSCHFILVIIPVMSQAESH